MTTNDLTGLEATHNRDRLSFQNQLASGLAGDTINDARADNNELRTERDYQTGRSDKAQQDAINQRLMEQQFGNDDFQKALQEAQFGYGNNPVNTLGQFSGILGQQGQQGIQSGIESADGTGGFGDLLKGIGGLFGGGGTAPAVTRGGKPISSVTDLIKTTV